MPHLAKEVVGAEAVVVPYGDLEAATAQVLPPYGRVHEGLTPSRLAGTGYCLGAPLRLLAVAAGE